MGCAGLLARLAAEGARIHVLYPRRRRLPPLRDRRGDDLRAARRRDRSGRRAVRRRLLDEIAYGDEDMIERLDTLAQRDLVDRFEPALNEHEPELLLLPARAGLRPGPPRRAFAAGVAAARPIAPQFGKWLSRACSPTRCPSSSGPIAPAALRVVLRHHGRDGDQARGDPPVRDDAPARAAHPQPRQRARARDAPRHRDRGHLRGGVRRAP